MIDFKKMLLCISTGVFLSASSIAAETTLRVATWLPPTNPLNKTVWPTWKKWVEDATEGRVNVVIEDYTGHPKTIFDAVEDGVYDVGFSVNSYIPGRFTLTSLAEIPGETPDAESASVALWKTYQEYFKDAGEFDGLKLLALFVHSPGQIHSKFPVNTLSDLKGKKVRLGGGMVNELGQRLELTIVSAPATKSYEMMQQGVVDATFLPAQEQKLFRLSEVSSNLILFPNGLYNSAMSFVMNEDAFEGLSDVDREAILSVSGEKLSRLAGAVWAESDKIGISEAKEKGVNVTFLKSDDELVKEFNRVAKGLDGIWLKSVENRGVDAVSGLAAFRKYVAEERANK